MGLFLSIVMILLPSVAYAYVGPSLGGGMVAIVVGVLMSVVLAFVAILWYPFKSYLKKRKKVAGSGDKTEKDRRPGIVIEYIEVLLISVIAVELVIFFPLINSIKILASVADKAQHVMRSSRISDHWKAKVLLVYSGRIFTHTVIIAFWLAVFVLIVAGLSIAMDYLLFSDSMSLMMSGIGIVYMTVCAFGHYKLRAKFFSS